MNTTRNRTILALGIAMALAAGVASATNGYYTTGTGTKSKGQAGAGSANPQEVMAMATNPAGIAFVPEAIEAGLSIFSPIRISFENRTGLFVSTAIFNSRPCNSRRHSITPGYSRV